MRTAESNATPQTQIDLLSRLLFQHSQGDLESILPDLQLVSSFDESQLSSLLELASENHVVVRAFEVLQRAAKATGDQRIERWTAAAVGEERARAEHAVSVLERICNALEAQGCTVAVIKSLDHWPDLGSDLDLYTIGDPEKVQEVMRRSFDAQPMARSWGDRLANKWNFSVPGLPELIEIHVRYLGQTGEHNKMARRIIERRVPKTVSGHRFLVAAPEERILISTLQRMYRHFYFRLCDMADVAALLEAKALDFDELRRAADVGGIWPGVATFLFLVHGYVERFGGTVAVPKEVRDATCSPHIRVYFENGFLRVPKLPAAGLYGAQILTAGRKGDLRAFCRLPLLPPLAVTALIAMHITGNDKGIW
ncbi:MAG TPA: nucleotidyltransferase family protein [Terriglobales bacterium]|nr:nucleotidyltransferase family protein [Terriglobales bacterium]